MKKILMILLCVCVLSVSAFAVSPEDYEVINEDGTSYFDLDGYNAAVAREKVTAAGLDLDVSSYWVTDWLGNVTFDNDAFEADYNAATEAQASAESEGVNDEPPLEDPSDNTGYPVGSYVDEAGNVFSPEGELLSPGTTPAADPGTDDTVSADVLDTSGEAVADAETAGEPVYVVNDLRSADHSAEAGTYAASTSRIAWYTNWVNIAIDKDGSIYNDVGYLTGYILNPDVGINVSSLTSKDKFVTGYIPLAELLSVIRIANCGGMNSIRICFYDEFFTFMEGYYSLNDLSADESSGVYKFSYTGNASYFRISGVFAPNVVITINEEIVEHYGEAPMLSGLKAVIISIFGEYTPVYSTGSVTETVGDVTTTTLYDVVADGAAGIDFEWVAGVFLVGILLYCLMKLLGGILK